MKECAGEKTTQKNRFRYSSPQPYIMLIETEL